MLSPPPTLDCLETPDGGEYSATRPSRCRRSRWASLTPERSAFGIVTDLTTADYVLKDMDGRRNR